MARSRRGNRNPSSVLPPRYSLRSFSVAIGIFVALNVGLLVLVQQESGTVLKMSKPTTKESVNLFQTSDDIPHDVVASLDAIFVLGGGVPLSIDEPPVFVQRRCDDAAKVVQRHARNKSKKKDLSILCLSAGTAHLPQLLGPDGLPIWESTASSAYLLKKYPGIIHPHQIYVETTSYDTIGNAFYARTSFTDINDWLNLLVVTNEFHMNRTQAIFEWIFGLDPDRIKGKYHLYFLSLPNAGLTAKGLQARQKREFNSLQSVQNHLAPKLRSMRDVWSFLTKEHSLYTAQKLVERGRQRQDNEGGSNEALKESYGGGKTENEGELRGR